RTLSLYLLTLPPAPPLFPYTTLFRSWIPYIRPGFTLAKQVGAAVRDTPDLKLIVLAKHGLVVWGDSAEEAYRRTIEVINQAADLDRKSTRLNSSHLGISYAVFCLKKK